MNLVSIEFLLLVLLALSLFHVARTPSLRRLILGATSAVFVASFTTSPVEALPLLLFLVESYACIRLVHAYPKRSWVVLSLIVLVASFAYLKRYTLLSPLPALPFPFVVVGLSYVLFRVLHLLIDAYGGTLRTRLGPVQFLEYTCFFLNWSSGPIQRYESFQAEIAESSRASGIPSDAYEAVSRVVNGYIKLALVSAFLLHLHREALAKIPELGPGLPGMGVYCLAAATFTLYMYYNFLGYMDIVIGIGRLFGIRLPENFDKPFSAPNFLDFWSRWHITLSEWFKFYVFNPLTKALIQRWPNPRAAVWFGVAAYFVTFLLMGIWHGSTPAFIVYGMFLGCGVSGNKLYQELARRYLGKRRYKRVAALPVYRFICRGMVFAYFATGLACFWMSPSDMKELLRDHGVMQVITAFAGVSLCASVVLSLVQALSGPARWFSCLGAWLTRDGYLRYAYLGAKVYAVAMAVVVNANAVPDVLYKVY